MANLTRAQRAAREQETRENESRIKPWQPIELLPEPNPREGWTHRWVRATLVGRADNANVSSQFRAGWEPCKAEDYPELQIMPDRGSQFQGNIELGGLLLCRIPTEVIEGRKAYYERMAEQQMEAVDNSFMKENDPRMPLFNERRSEVTFGRGSK